MIITKEQQEAWVNNYVKEKHTQEECIGFIDGIQKALDVVCNNSKLSDISKQREQFIAFAKFAKNYQSDKNVEIAWEQWIKKQ